MELLERDGETLVFRLGRREKQLFTELLKLYPLIPASHHRLHRTAGSSADAAAQSLLAEAMAEHKQQGQQRVKRLLANKDRLREEPRGYRLSLDPTDLEWLLQVLNDVRVGSWLVLGCPDPDEGTAPKPSLENARYVVAMELSGFFQQRLLEALD